MNSKISSWLLLIILALIWGSSFILMKKGLIAYDSNQVGALRILIAFLSLLPFAITHLKKEYLSKWKYFLAVGLFGNFIPAFLFTLAETRISSSLAGLLNSLTPIFTLLIGLLVFGIAVRKNQVIGIILGFIGAAILILGPGLTGIARDSYYGLLVVIATICYGISVNVIRKHLGGVPSVATTFWAFLLVGPFAGVYLITTDFTDRLATHPFALSSLGYTAILGVVGTAGAVILFNVLIKKTNAIFASSVTYLIPIVALGWGVSDGESIGFVHFTAILVILTGIFLINRPSGTKKPA